MKHRGLIAFFCAGCLAFGLTLAGVCARGQTPSAANATSSIAQTSIIVTGPTGERFTLDEAQMAKMGRKTIQVHNGHTGAEETYEGVPLLAVLDKVGAPSRPTGKGASMYVLAEGSDHYRALLSLTEVMPAFHPGDVLIADRLNGHPISNALGPFRLIVSEDEHPARWVRNLAAIHLVEAP